MKVLRFEEKTLLVGVGAPKCGTSWLYGYLRDHPQVFMSPIKEMHVWNARYRPDTSGHWDEIFVEKLEALKAKAGSEMTFEQRRMAAALQTRIAMTDDPAGYAGFFEERVKPFEIAFGEVTPAYALLREDGLRALRAQHPKVRLMFLMRDPVERFWSALRMRQRQTQGFSAEREFDAAWDDAALIERGRYDLTLEAIDKVFPRNEVWIGFYETLFTPARIGALCSFLGIEFRRPDFDRRPNVGAEAELGPVRRRIARERFDPVYAYCRERFGDRLPKEWS